MLLFIYPFTTRNLLFYEKLFIIFEDAARWKSPFNGLGYYLLVRLEKDRYSGVKIGDYGFEI